MCKVSVIIPVYNVEKYIDDCLQSVLSQTLQDFEVICIDDASPDRCPEILDSYAAKDPRISVIHLPENHMQGYGRNRGLERAGGKYVYFLDSDDMIVPEALEEMTSAAEKEDLDGLFFDAQTICEDAELDKKHTAHRPVRIGVYRDTVQNGPALLEEFSSQNEWYVYVQREFWKREYLLKNDIFNIEGVEHEDDFFSFKAILLAERVRYIRKTWFIRRLRPNSVMTREAEPKDFHGYFLTYYHMMDLVEKNGIKSPAAMDCMMHMYECMELYHEVFLEQEDPESWFAGTDLLPAYRMYAAFRRSEERIREARKKCWDGMTKEKSIQIYGAGKIGRRVFRQLKESDFYVTCFIVTDTADNPDTVYGLPVRSVQEIDEDQDAVTIVAMSPGFQEDVVKILAGKNAEYYLFLGNQLKGPFRGKGKPV